MENTPLFLFLSPWSLQREQFSSDAGLEVIRQSHDDKKIPGSHWCNQEIPPVLKTQKNHLIWCLLTSVSLRITQTGYRVFTRELVGTLDKARRAVYPCFWALLRWPWWSKQDNSSQKIFQNAVVFCGLSSCSDLQDYTQPSQANPLSYNFSPGEWYRSSSPSFFQLFNWRFHAFFFPPAVKSFEDAMKIAKTQHKDRVVLLNFKGPLTQSQPAGSVKEAKDRRCALCKD